MSTRLTVSAFAFLCICFLYSCSERPAAVQKHMVRMPAVPPTAQPMTNPSITDPPFRFQLQYAQFAENYAGAGNKLQTGCHLLRKKPSL